MWFWVFMLVMDLLTPITMIYFGFRFEKNPPKEINALFGYRTVMSMKNQNTWKFAHKYIGKLWKVCGWPVLLMSTAAMLFVFEKNIIVVSIIGGAVCVIQILIMICTMIPHRNCAQKEF